MKPVYSETMIDFHTHILPGVDDGSKNLGESLQLLQMEQQQGIDIVVLTPHYYSSQNSPEVFFRRRYQSWRLLRGAWKPGMPRLLLGAEVEFFEGITALANLQDFCIQRTSLLLLEMPFCSWSERIIRIVEELNGTGGIQIVLAHVERYLSFQGNAQALKRLRQGGILMQVNASFFEGWLSRRKALSMLDKGMVQFLGSDCHNLSSRKPNWELVPKAVMQSMEASSKYLLRQYMYR